MKKAVTCVPESPASYASPNEEVTCSFAQPRISEPRIIGGPHATRPRTTPRLRCTRSNLETREEGASSRPPSLDGNHFPKGATGPHSPFLPTHIPGAGLLRDAPPIFPSVPGVTAAPHRARPPRPYLSRARISTDDQPSPEFCPLCRPRSAGAAHPSRAVMPGTVACSSSTEEGHADPGPAATFRPRSLGDAPPSSQPRAHDRRCPARAGRHLQLAFIRPFAENSRNPGSADGARREFAAFPLIVTQKIIENEAHNH